MEEQPPTTKRTCECCGKTLNKLKVFATQKYCVNCSVKLKESAIINSQLKVKLNKALSELYILRSEREKHERKNI